MKMKKRMLVVLVLLAACQPPLEEVEQNPQKTADPAACGADKFEKYLWQPAAELHGVPLPIGARVYRPGTALTQDYRTDRLNIALGESGRIERIYCG